MMEETPSQSRRGEGALCGKILQTCRFALKNEWKLEENRLAVGTDPGLPVF